MPPIDINLLRVEAGNYYYSNPNLLTGGDPEKVKKSERDRFRDDKIVDDIIEIDARWRKSIIKISFYTS
jgi:seryl-tRNA synthetase